MKTKTIAYSSIRLHRYPLRQAFVCFFRTNFLQYHEGAARFHLFVETVTGYLHNLPDLSKFLAWKSLCYSGVGTALMGAF